MSYYSSSYSEHVELATACNSLNSHSCAQPLQIQQHLIILAEDEHFHHVTRTKNMTPPVNNSTLKQTHHRTSPRNEGRSLALQVKYLTTPH
jgi:hypothetical protein